MNDDYYVEPTSSGRPKGPLGIDPLHFSAVLFSLLLLFVLYLLLPRGLRVHYFRGYPKRYAWSARSRAARGRRANGLSSINGHHASASSVVGSSIAGLSQSHRQFAGQNIGNMNSSPYASNSTRRVPSALSGTSNLSQQQHFEASQNSQQRNTKDEIITFSSQQELQNQQHQHTDQNTQHPLQQQQPQQQQQIIDLQQNEEIVISAAMQQLRDPGVLIVAHGSRGKPKTVRLQLTESAITWRTETRKKNLSNHPHSAPPPPKMGKLHQVPLSNIMYVDVGKQTTALRRVENAGVSESLCFSLLTKEGSLDLEANSPRERDALVSCFSLVLDEVHAQNWRDIYRGPSSDMPSSFDDFEGDEVMLEKKL